jgi:hypothetical protein
MIMAKSIPLPAPPTGWFDYDYAVLWNGDLALVRSDRDIHAALGHWRDQQQSGDIHAPEPNLLGARLRLTAFDGKAESNPIEVPACGRPMVNRLSDGRWLVASTQATANESNAHLYGADGAPDASFAIGDGIQHIQCGADGTIWVGYFDEGVFSHPISSSGIARFGPDGRVLWKFNDQDRAGLFISDCYALTLDESTVWCCPYTDFPIVQVELGAVKHWRSEVAGAVALAVEGDLVLLAGGYRDQSERIAMLRLGDNQAHQIGEWQFHRFDRNAAWLLQGRGGTLHIVAQGNWTKLSLAAIRAARGLNSRA